MKFEEIQNPEDLKKFFTEKKCEIQEHEDLIKIDRSHYLKFEILDELDHRIAGGKLREFKNRYKTEVQYLLLINKSFQRFFFLRDYGTPIKFTYDKTRDYAPETEGALFKKLNGMKYSDSDFNESINNLFDVKEIVKKFYEEYKGIKSKLANAISNLDGDPYLYAQTILDRIIFLYFLQTKGVLTKTYLSDFYSSKKRSGNYYRDYLKPLFFQILNTEHDPMMERIINGINFGKVPYLNGGLFSEKDIEINNPDIRIKDSAWDHIFNLLNSYEWVIEEEKGDSTTLTPSILGHIYEKSVIAATQKETGSYYTPEEITTYISKNTIYPYITDRINEKFNTNYKNIWNELLNKKNHTEKEIEIIRYLYFDILKNLTVLDNACGSGAFLIAAEQHVLRPIYNKCIFALKNEDFFYAELEKIRKHKSRNYYIKKTIITNNLYGVDIQEGAVEIAKLRLWLSMVSEMELDLKDIEPLPNIDYNILCGNSLIGFVEPPTSEQVGLYDTKTVKDIMRARGDLIEIYKNATASKEVRKLKDDIERMNQLRDELDKKLLLEFKEKKINITKEELKNLKPFHWGFEFYDVFDRGGFDVVIGNPPYGNILKKEEIRFLDKIYLEHTGRIKNSAMYFIYRSEDLLTKKSDFSYIIPKSICYSNGWNVTASAIINNLTKLIDVGKAFEDVKLEQVIFVIDYNKSNKAYITGLFDGRKITEESFMDKNIFFNYHIMLTGLKKEEIKIIRYILENCEDKWGEYVKIMRGLNWQSKTKTYTGETPISRGSQLNRYYLEAPTDCIDLSNFRVEDYEYQLKPKILNQLAIAHVMNPYPHFYLQASLDDDSCLVFETISCTFLRNDNIDLKFLLAINNSKLFAWVLYKFIYSNAIRSTRYDDLYVRKVPINKLLDITQQPFIRLCDYMLLLNKTEELRKSEKELIEFIDRQIIDSLVYELYFKEELKSNLLELVEPYLKETNSLEEIREIADKIKSDKNVMETIDEIKNHEWVKVIEGSD